MIMSLYHRHWGDPNAPAVVAIHGLFGSMENLGMITRLLKQRYSVYGIDLPNHGRSSHTETTSLLIMANAVIDWMDAQGLQQVYFLGHSLGGKVIMEIALRYPERVRALIVADIAPVEYPRRHDDVFAAFKAVDLETLKSRADADKVMANYVAEASTRSFLLKNLEKTESGWRWRVNLSTLINDYPQLIQANTADFPLFNGPVLFIKGELSPYIQIEHQDATLALFPQASVKVIHNTEHWLHAEKPEVFTRIVTRFLENLEGDKVSTSS